MKNHLLTSGLIALLLALTACTGTQSPSADPGKSSSGSETQVSDAAPEPNSTESEPATGNSGLKVEINGVEYKFPMPYQEFIDRGWALSETVYQAEDQPNFYADTVARFNTWANTDQGDSSHADDGTSVSPRKNDTVVYDMSSGGGTGAIFQTEGIDAAVLFLYNPSDTRQPYVNCKIVGFDTELGLLTSDTRPGYTDRRYLKTISEQLSFPQPGTIVINDTVSVGAATVAEVKAAFQDQPTVEGDDLIMYGDASSEYSITFKMVDGIVKTIKLRYYFF